MINDLNDTLAALLEHELALKEAGINVVFAAPDTRFFQKITPPLIAIFLYDIRENLALRVSEPFAQQKTAGADTTALIRSPVPIDYSYLITAWGSNGSETAPDKDQHDMLSRVLHALLRHPIWPAARLKGQLAAHPLPRCLCCTIGPFTQYGRILECHGRASAGSTALHGNGSFTRTRPDRKHPRG